jgi:hypothetical protein
LNARTETKSFWQPTNSPEPALAWWENYCAAAEDASTITWEEFVREFHRYHIPSATMKRKADEFRALQQGSMTVEEYTHRFMELARYAPEEVNNNDKKQDMFKKGLNPELRTLLTPQIYPDFNRSERMVRTCIGRLLNIPCTIYGIRASAWVG